MKRLLTVIFVCLCALTAQAQNEHLTFKSVPIDGHLIFYIEKMKLKGFSLVEKEDNSARLKGDFAGVKDCFLDVATLSYQDLVYYITVSFPVQEDWEGLFGMYSELKSMLTEKYGKPANVVEEFTRSRIPKEDKEKYGQATLGYCKYKTTFSTSLGTIELQIESDKIFNCFVTLTYTDRINSNRVRQKAIDDL